MIQIISAIIALILTVIIGPLTFYILSHTIYKKSKDKFPTGINALYGDIIFLPLFNAILFYNPIVFENLKLTISIFIAILITITYLIIDLKYSNYIDWSKKTNSKLNFGGYYHTLFMLLQSIIIVYGISINLNNIYLYLALFGYIVTAVLEFKKECHF